MIDTQTPQYGPSPLPAEARARKPDPQALAEPRTSSRVVATSVPIASARYVLPVLAQSLTGYTVKAIQRKIERGDWIEGKVWIRAPDGRVIIDMVGYHKWVEGHR